MFGACSHRPEEASWMLWIQHGGAGSALTTEPPLHFVTIPTVLSIQETPQIMSLTHLRAYTMTIQG